METLHRTQSHRCPSRRPSGRRGAMVCENRAMPRAGWSERRALRLFVVAGLAGLVLAPAGWLVSDRLERDNDFCNACHLQPGVPLHIDIRTDLDARPAANLAAVHAAAGVDGRDDSAFRCIDCHGGHSLVGRARVKALAAKDAFWYAVGRFEEPDGMRWPLWDEDCRKCHATFDATPSAEWEVPRFHELPVHNVDLQVDCVECHLVHEDGGNPDAHFIDVGWVRTRCARCHAEFEAETY